MKRFLFLAVLSGILFAFSYPPYNLELFVWLGFAPLFLLVFSVGRTKNGDNFFAGFFTGFIYFLMVMKWFWSVYPLTWTGIENNFISFVLIGLIWIISAAGMAIWWGFAALGAAQIKKLKIESKNKISSVFSSSFLIIPSVFTLTEYIRSWFFGFLWFGSGTLLGPHWTMGNLAYALHNNPLFLKLSSFTGIYGITFLIVLINVLIFRFLNFSKPAKLIIAVLIAVSLTLVPKLSEIFSRPAAIENKVPIAVIQTKILSGINYPAEKQLDDFKKQLNLLKEAANLSLGPKVVIFPEGANFFKNLSVFLDVKETKNFFEKTFPEPTLIIDNSRINDENGKTKSRVIYLDSKRGALGFYDKRFLTPGGEFIPFHLKFFISVFSKNWPETFSQVREFSKGEGAAEIVTLDDIRTGALVCSGILSNGLFRNLSEQNPDFLIALASTRIFKGSEDLIKQNIAAVKFRAAENNKYVVLAANYGYSYVISNKGKVQKITPDKDWQLFTAEVVPLRTKTWYNKLRDFPLLILTFSTILINVIATKRRSF